MKRYYVEFKINESAVGFGMSQMISVVHWFNGREKLNCGFDFPDFDQDQIGYRCRIFSKNPKHLRKIIKSPRLNELKSQGVIFGGDKVNAVPDNCEEVQLVRNNPAERRTPSYWMRYGYSYEEAGELIDTLSDVKEVYHAIKLHSFSSKRPMMRCLSRLKVHKRIDGKFSSYGYSRMSAPATVPHF